MDPDQLVSTAASRSGSTLFSKESIAFRKVIMSNGPCREKTCLRGFRHSKFQTSLRTKSRYETFQKANKKGADQTGWIASWFAPVLFPNPRRQVFSR